MRFAAFDRAGGEHVGLVIDEAVFDLTALCAEAKPAARLSVTTMHDVIARADDVIATDTTMPADIPGRCGQWLLPPDSLRLFSPLGRMSKNVFCGRSDIDDVCQHSRVDQMTFPNTIARAPAVHRPVAVQRLSG